MAEIFVGRAPELEAIENTFEPLLDPRRLVREPIHEYLGPAGIGKSVLLGRAAIECARRGIDCIEQAETVVQHDLPSVKERLTHGPLVLNMELDGLSGAQLHTTEENLEALFDDDAGKLIVLMASSTDRDFTTRSISRKISRHTLPPLDPQDSAVLVEQYAPTIAPEARQTIIDWTGGYPLGLRTMADILKRTGLSPADHAGRRQIFDSLTDEVVNRRLIVQAQSPEAQDRIHSLLALLSIPRRFNLVLAQELIEAHAPVYKRDRPLQYWLMPKEIDIAAPGALRWDMTQGGFVVHNALRPILGLKYSVGDPETYRSIHDFLADWNKTAAEVVSSPTDQERYLDEAAYHEDMLKRI